MIDTAALYSRPKKLGTALWALLAAGLGVATPLHAVFYTYSFSNIPSIQANADLSGSITIDTAGGTESPASSGGFFVGYSAITSWDFTVTPSGGVGAYSASNTTLNSSASGSGGATALYASPTSLTVVGGSSLILAADLDDTSGKTVQLEWVYNSPIYFVGGIGVGGATWLNTNRTELDNAFPVNPDASAQSWVIATAVPEVSNFSLILGFGAMAFSVWRRPKRS